MESIEMVTPETLIPQRKRAFKPKSSTGCMTCRIRRVKCDEVRPQCTQCVRGRRVCDGYPCSGNSKRRTKPTTDRTLVPNIPASNSIGPSIYPDLFKSPQEIRCFDYFVRFTIPKLTGSSKSVCWESLILQAVQHESAIRHAAIALGALHESYEARSEGSRLLLAWKDNGFALKHYVKAIGFVATPSDQIKKYQLADVALVTSILFVCFDLMRGNHAEAMTHIDAGVKLFSEIVKASGSSPPTTKSTYAPFFAHLLGRLDSQASEISHNRPRTLFSTTPNPCEAADLSDNNVKRPFRDLCEARLELESIQNAALRSTMSVLQHDLTKDEVSKDILAIGEMMRKNSQTRLAHWSIVFNDSDPPCDAKPGTDDEHALRIMKIQRINMDINFNIDLTNCNSDEMLWDKFSPEFNSLVTLCGEVVESTPQRSVDGGIMERLPEFTLDSEIILPLFLVASKCRDGQLRRKAISLLKSGQRQEGVWCASGAALVADRLVAIEEDGLEALGGYADVEHIRPEKRIIGIAVHLVTEDQEIKLRYRHCNRGNKVIEEFIGW